MVTVTNGSGFSNFNQLALTDDIGSPSSIYVNRQIRDNWCVKVALLQRICNCLTLIFSVRNKQGDDIAIPVYSQEYMLLVYHTTYLIQWILALAQFNETRCTCKTCGKAISETEDRADFTHKDTKHPDPTACNIMAMFWRRLALLAHWDRVTHICVSKVTIKIRWRQAIIWTSAGILLIGPSGTNFSEMSIEIITCSIKKMRLKVSSAKWRPFGVGLNVLSGRH